MYSTSWKLNSCPPTESHSGSCVKVAVLPQSRDRPEKTKHIVDMNIVQYISNREDRFCGNFKVYPPILFWGHCLFWRRMGIATLTSPLFRAAATPKDVSVYQCSPVLSCPMETKEKCPPGKFKGSPRLPRITAYSAVWSAPRVPLTSGLACAGPASEAGEIGWFPAPLVVVVVFSVGDAKPLTAVVAGWDDALVGDECTPFGKTGDSTSTIDSSAPCSL